MRVMKPVGEKLGSVCYICYIYSMGKLKESNEVCREEVGQCLLYMLYIQHGEAERE